MSTNKSKIPLDSVEEYRPRLSSVSIENIPEPLNTLETIPTQGVTIISGHSLEDTKEVAELLQITQEDLQQMATDTNIRDITDFGEFVPTTDTLDATEFPTITDDKTEAIEEKSKK